jgi:ParB family transcriptional regulator, chromosome partitioning protein
MSETKQKSRLGRGLSSLISMPAEAPVGPALGPGGVGGVETEVAPPPLSVGVGEISVAEIVPNPHQPRRTINAASIAELAASLKMSGVIQPIVVRRVAGGYELIAGERRWRAAKQAGFSAIPAVIRDVDRFTQAQMALVENIQREDLNPIDRATGYRTIIEQLSLTQAELATRLGEDRSTIANHLRLLDLPEGVRGLVRDGKLQLGHAKLLAGLSNVAEQERLANLVVGEDLSVRSLEKMIQGRPAEVVKAKSGGPSAAYLSDLEKSITRQIGLRVVVKASAKKGKGRLVIHYKNLDEFDGLMNMLGVKTET